MHREFWDSFWDLQGSIGPLWPGVMIDVPLWFAKHLRTKNKCTIVPPSELAVEKVEELLAQERANEDTLMQLPSLSSAPCQLSPELYYFEIFALLLDMSVFVF